MSPTRGAAGGVLGECAWRWFAMCLHAWLRQRSTTRNSSRCPSSAAGWLFLRVLSVSGARGSIVVKGRQAGSGLQFNLICWHLLDPGFSFNQF